MCGIAGYVGAVKGDLLDLEAAMRSSIRYRGRDGEGAWTAPGEAAVFHSRLSILDISGGAQPMSDRSDRFICVFNGEIYNFLELRNEYEARGAQFKTNSDTEVILEGFKLKAEKVCDDLNGMFSFAIWDKMERRLFLARDRLGKKPLYWTSLNGVFYFASSLDAFRCLPDWTNKLSRLDLDSYGAIGDFLPGRTAFIQGRALPPGTHATVDLASDGLPRVETYWRMDFSRKFAGTLDEATDAFETLIVNATAIRLRADVPVALTFSGGVDSGIIAAICQQELRYQIPCWTIDYHTAEDPSEEALIAEQVARHLGLEWHFQNFDYHTDLIPSLRDAFAFVDQPSGHAALGYSRSLYAAIHKTAKVVISGNGADELFLGYSGNENLAVVEQKPGWRDKIRGILSLGADRAHELAKYQAAYILANLGSYSGEDDPEVGTAAICEGIVAANVTSRADLYTYMALRHYTMDSNFRTSDIAGMAEQVEVRSPFLDYRMVEFAASLPTQFKIGSPNDASANKFILKRYYNRYVPDNIAWATKKGMGANLRYDRTLADAPELLALYEKILGRISDAGMPTESYRKAWQDYVREKRAGVQYPSSAGKMMTGLLLGLWLDRNA